MREINITNNPAVNLTDTSSVRIEFPCEGYPIKIVGEASPDYERLVLEVVAIHAPDFDRSSVTVRDSKNGRYCSVTAKITATGEPQLKALFEDLKLQPLVRMVL